MNYFSIIGYVSVLLGVAVLFLWMVQLRMRLDKKPRPVAGGLQRWLCFLALGVAIVAAILAKVNSVTYVNRIQLDQSAEIQAAQAKQDAARKLAEKSRSGAVAQVRFAEDSSADFMDEGGMDSADLKYMEKIRKAGEPEWKQAKKTRNTGGKPDDSLETQIGGQEEKKGVAPPPETEEHPVIMMASKKALADRLDNLNLKLTRLLVFLAMLFVLLDYLYCFNRYEEAFLPLPIPSAWVTAVAPLAPRSERSVPPRRTLNDELAWLSKRGDTFVYLTDKPMTADQIPSLLPRLGKQGWPIEVIRVKRGDAIISEDFIFEALWYGRASFVVDSTDRIQALLERFQTLLSERKACRAKVSQTVHLVWDCYAPPPDLWQTENLRLMKATGFTLFVCKE